MHLLYRLVRRKTDVAGLLVQQWLSQAGLCYCGLATCFLDLLACQ